MQTTILRPSSPGKYPGIVFYSEIFQLTGPIMRTATALAGHGFVVAVPEIYHTTSAGWVGEYTTEGADEGNRLKVATPAESHDGDSAAVLAYLRAHPACTGKLGTAGFCIGGHLSLRAAMMNDGVSAVASWYPTDMHTGDGVCAGLVDRTKVGVHSFLSYSYLSIDFVQDCILMFSFLNYNLHKNVCLIFFLHGLQFSIQLTTLCSICVWIDSNIDRFNLILYRYLCAGHLQHVQQVHH